LVRWSRQQTELLLQQADFTEARSVAALLLAQQYLEANPDVFKQTA
jgi:ADP-ribose diphosphatase